MSESLQAFQPATKKRALEYEREIRRLNKDFASLNWLYQTERETNKKLSADLRHANLLIDGLYNRIDAAKQ